MKKILYYDCFAGISGDMNLGALVDLGVDPAHLKKELAKLNIEGFRLEIGPDMRKGISGTRIAVVVENPDNEKNRHLSHIEALVNGSGLSENIKRKSLDIFDRIAVAEAKVHSISKEEVHFHEVGALDSIADIVGAAICQEYLEVDEIHASPVELGGGVVKCAHGLMPVPAPATVEIVKDMPVRTGLVQYEATTPTGAAILAATVNRFSETTQMTILKTGYGIGQRDGEIPNVLRVYLGKAGEDDSMDVEVETAIVLECNIDDMSPERYTHIQELLFEAGASDVWTLPITMKKSRPATMLCALCPTGYAGRIRELILSESSTIGLREYAVRKSMLRREVVTVPTLFGEVEVKRSFLNGKVVREKPEFEQCSLLARENGITLEEVYRVVMKNL